MIMKKTLLLAVISCWALQGCLPAAIGGAAAGAGVIHDRRSTGMVVDNNTLRLKLKSLIANNKSIYDNSHFDVTVYNDTVLVTGEVASERIKSQITTIIRGNVPPEIKRIFNYALVGPRSSLMNRLYDTKITAKVKSVLTDVRVNGFDPTRVKVVTSHGVVFLLGIVTQQEAQGVTNVARRVEGVRRVVTLFTIDNTLNTVKGDAFKNVNYVNDEN